MKRIHYSAEPLGEIVTPESAGRPDGHWKPRGLYYSVGEEWKEWCEGSGFELEKLKVATEVEVDLVRMIVLRERDQVLAFTRHYDKPAYPGARTRVIDWERVGRDYAGVELNPYHREWSWEWGFLEAGMWYSGWDCASGCVWDRTAIWKVREDEGRGAGVGGEAGGPVCGVP